MRPYLSMEKALSDTGLYEFENTTVNCEILAYSVEIERLNNLLNRMLKEAFFQTAGSYGLTNYELIYGPSMDNLPLQKRRDMLIKRESINRKDFTLSGFDKALSSFNMEYVINEFPQFNRVMVYAEGDYTDARKEWIRSQVEKILPAHLEWQVLFNSISWDKLDEKDLTFTAFDTLDMSWDDFDNLTEEDE